MTKFNHSTKTKREERTKMKHVKLMVAALAGAAFTWGALATTSAYAEMVKGPKVTWKFNVWGKKRAFTAGVDEMARLVSEKTGGNFKIKIFYGDQLGGKKQNLDNLKAGVFDAAKVCWAYHPGKVQSMMVLNLPFLPVANAEMQMKVSEAVYKHPIPQKELADKWGVFVLMSSLLPQYEFMGRGPVPKTLAGWKGLTVRSLGGLADAMRKVGSSISTMTATEVYQALDRGAVDAISFPFSYAHAAYKIDEVSEWYTANLAPGTNDCPDVVSIASWNKLPKQYQELMNDSKAQAYKVLAATYKAKDAKNLPKFRKKMKEIKYTAAELKNFRAVAGQPVYDDWIAKNQGKFDAKGLLDFVLKTAATN